MPRAPSPLDSNKVDLILDAITSELRRSQVRKDASSRSQAVDYTVMATAPTSDGEDELLTISVLLKG